MPEVKLKTIKWDGNQITTPGMYSGIPLDSYHRGDICDGASVSSSGLRKNTLFTTEADSKVDCRDRSLLCAVVVAAVIETNVIMSVLTASPTEIRSEEKFIACPFRED